MQLKTSPMSNYQSFFQLLKAQPTIEANGQAKLDGPKKTAAGSRACAVM